jgi:hypothetical protein
MIKIFYLIVFSVLTLEQVLSVRNRGETAEENQKLGSPFKIESGANTLQEAISSGSLSSADLDFVLQQRSCMGFVIGFDYLETAIIKMIQQYIDIFNDRYDGKRQTP